MLDISTYYRMKEDTCVSKLIQHLNLDAKTYHSISQLAQKFILTVRGNQERMSAIEAFMQEYDLSTEEGVMLMCIAEALLRTPDSETQSLLIRDKLLLAENEAHLGKSESFWVNLATRGLVFAEKILSKENIFEKMSKPVVRKAFQQGIKKLSTRFVLGSTMQEALKNSQFYREKGYSFSYDMLGESAKTLEDAQRYFNAYKDAIAEIGQSFEGNFSFKGPSISVKLSALYPRYEFAKQNSCVPFLTERLNELAVLAKENRIGLTIDAEEADRLEMSLKIFATVFKNPSLQDWPGLGLAVQAYQKRAYFVLENLIDLAKQQHKKIPVRLVKGAYWDTEIKLSQMAGYCDYPVFTRKINTDISYLACSKLMLGAPDAVYPQFATHNAFSIAAILAFMQDPRKFEFEFQNLQGMGKTLHDQLVDPANYGISSRIYAPVGHHADLLPYLVRRLLENGANSSFVNQIADKDFSVDNLIINPVEKVLKLKSIANPKIPLPSQIFGEKRQNSTGVDLTHSEEREALFEKIKQAHVGEWLACTRHQEKSNNREKIAITNPADRNQIVGHCYFADETDVETALENARNNFNNWNATNLETRAEILKKTGDLLEKNRGRLVAMAVYEAGKTIPDAISEVREAVDFCRYYAMMALDELAPKELIGPTGESNILFCQGRGVMACISPWNFPIAIFTGQIAAALVAGNCVIAKPAEQTPLVAAFIIDLFYQAGLDKNVLHYLPGKGEIIGAKLISDPRIDGVLFTGSTETARLINQNLAARKSSIATLIAETGGINAMVVDSTALPEQVVTDVLLSAFNSAGQRCSALRVLFLQNEIADKVIHMLKGAMAELTMGHPEFLETDVGPVIDEEAKSNLMAHIEKMKKEAKLIYAVDIPKELKSGTFVAPHAFEIENLELIHKEVFGPILHIIRFESKNLETVIDSINALGYGLTFGIHSRINERIQSISKRIRAGNIYVNRNMIGAVVGVQPFGGLGLSGTGPKAGGPHYLLRLCTEVSVANNIVAMGGNTTLMTLKDEE